jgi:hypothetical protein
MVFLWISTVWILRLADPIVHSVLHDHHEHCVEEGIHLHESDELCTWSDPATWYATPSIACTWSWVRIAHPDKVATPFVVSERDGLSLLVRDRGPPNLV